MTSLLNISKISSLVLSSVKYRWLITVLLLSCHLVYAQQDQKRAVNTLLEKGSEMLQDSNYTAASTFGQQALTTAKLRQWVEEEGRSYLLLAKIAYLQSHYTDALSNGVQAAAKLELTSNMKQRIAAYHLLTEVYDHIQTYNRALVYGQKLEKIYAVDSAQSLTMAHLRFAMAEWYAELKDYEQAEQHAYASLESYQRIIDTPDLAKVHELLIKLLQKQGKYEKAIPHALWLVNVYNLEKKYEHKVAALNTLGFLYKRNEEDKKAIEAFEQAVALSRSIYNQPTASLLINLGLANSNVGNNKQAIGYYQQALEMHQQNGNQLGEAEVYNYLASHYFLSDRQEKALEVANKASQVALQEQDNSLLSDNYLLLKLIYKKEEYWEKAEEYQIKLTRLQEQIAKQEAEEREKQLRLDQMAELHEEKIRIAWNEKEKIALDKERQESQLKIQNQELSLLKKEKELQRLALEKQKLQNESDRQSLSLVQQQLVTAQQESAMSEMKRSQELQELRVKQKDLEQQKQQQKQQQTIQLLEADKKLKQQKIDREATLRNYSLSLAGLFLVVVLVVTFFLYQKSKDNQILQKQKEEISSKNEMLHQNEIALKNHLEYLEAARQMLSEQQEQLTAVHNRVQDSIEYARHIQQSILPDNSFLNHLFPENCVIFQPKDVVSGDFYWVSDQGNYQVVIVADCTGHGVPGALITLIGHSLLTEAIQVHKMTEPDSILHFLHQRLADRFQTQESTRQHGMDMGVCVLQKDNDQYDLRFSGAKNNLNLIVNGQPKRFKGDRCSVGSSKTEMVFTRHQIQLRTGDVFYLSSDGFIDQPSPERKRFGSATLKELIRSSYGLPMSKQEEKLLGAFDTHRSGTELRDDVTLLGIRL